MSWKQYFVATNWNLLGEWGFMQMTVTSEGLLRNSKYIKMGREEGGFLSFPHTATSCNCLPWVNHSAVIHLRFCIGLKCRCSVSCQAKSVSTVAHFKPTYSLLIYNQHLFTWGALLYLNMNYLHTRRLCELKKSIGAAVFGF